MCQHVSECSGELNWNRAKGGNYFRPIKFVSIFSKVFVNHVVVLVRTFAISRFTILCRGSIRCVVLGLHSPSCLDNASSLYAIFKTGPSPCLHSPYQETTTTTAAPVHVTDGPPLVRLPSVRFPGETESPSQRSFDPVYVVRLPETSTSNRQGSVGSPLDTIVCNLGPTGTQRASSDRIAEIVLFFFFFSAVEIFPDVPLTQERQQNHPETPRPPLHVSESIVESSLGSNSAISKSTVVDVSNVGNAPVHSATTDINHPISTIASPLPKPPRQMIDRYVCRDWWYGRCYRNPCRFVHPESLPPQTHGYNIVRYSKRFHPVVLISLRSIHTVPRPCTHMVFQQRRRTQCARLYRTRQSLRPFPRS
jgi:hypothetical protein